MPPLSRGCQLLRAARRLAAPLRQPSTRSLSSHGSSFRNDIFKVSEEVREALETGKPVVALETTIYTHGQ